MKMKTKIYRNKSREWLEITLELERKRLEGYEDIDTSNLSEESLYRLSTTICSVKKRIFYLERKLGLPYSYKIQKINEEIRKIEE